MDSHTLVLFGATGDLAKRKIYPALFNLFIDHKLASPLSVIGLGRREWSDETFKKNVEQSLRDFSRRAPQDEAALQAFLEAFRYCTLDIGKKEDYQKLLKLIEHREEELSLEPNRLFYLSVGPEYFETIAAQIQDNGLGSDEGWKRLVIEKPFGHDLKSARVLNEKLSVAFAESEIFRIDHYLGKPVVQKLEALHQANPEIKALWSNRKVANVQITASETVGVEERAGYYDHVGAVRDMFQNHMLQLLMMVAIHIPDKVSADEVNEVHLHKKRVMKSLEPLHKHSAAAGIIRGQYKEGSIQGKPVAGYTSEPGITPDSMNDTFIAARLQINDSDWEGVPFYIRTGKRMMDKSTRIVVEFQEEATQLAATAEKSKAPNLLVLEMSPGEGITLQFKGPAFEPAGEFSPIQVELPEGRGDGREAYENLIHDALQGDPSFFAHWDEVELSWEWVQPILDAYEENMVPLQLYAAGSCGPAESDALLAKDGFHWWFDDSAKQESKTLKEESLV
ncbi:glucose-6-phosphate dehydrogenase [Paenibacillus sp. NPDC057934]|uniref:glucose-6-phosphate dehydrogenase n=1 Tax=Paenibacillus sp. NPDC057934 TaxID=3346282 RepID=UPI0036DD9585